MKKRKNKNKILIISLSVVVAVLVVIFSIVCSKSGPAELQLGSNTAICGDTVKLDFTLTDNPDLWGGQVKINYDPNAIEFISCANGGLFDECEVNSNEGFVNLLVNQSDIENTNVDGLVATLSFKVKLTAQKGSYDLEIDEETNFCDIEGNIKEITFIDGNITVK